MTEPLTPGGAGITTDDTRPLIHPGNCPAHLSYGHDTHTQGCVEYTPRPVRPHVHQCPCGATLDAARQSDDRLREAAQPILDRCLEFFGADDLDPESSEAMPVVIKNRWVYELRAALASHPTPTEGDTNG